MSEGAPRPPGARLRRRLEHEAALVLLAVQFLTRCPIPARVPCTEAGPQSVHRAVNASKTTKIGRAHV